MERTTVFSGCRKYRYTLWRDWGCDLFEGDGISRDRGYVQFIGLNPSTADEVNDDPTIRRCIDYAKRWGYGALCMTNIFAWRDTDPDKMKLAENPIGEPYDSLTVIDRPNAAPNLFDTWNDYWLAKIADGAAVTVAAWGKHGSHLKRADHVKHLIPNLHYLKLNGDGSPQHPLYLKSSLIPVKFS